MLTMKARKENKKVIPEAFDRVEVTLRKFNYKIYDKGE